MKAEKVLIVGGSSSMGLATAVQASSKGFRVVVAGRNEEKLRQIANNLGNQASYYQVDAMEEKQVVEMLRELAPIDHIAMTVNAPGSATSISNTSTEEAKLVFERFWMNYRILNLARECMSPNGSISLISGSSSKTPVAQYSFWGTLHGSIEALARNAALDLAPLRVNVVSPGGIGLKPDRQLVEHLGMPEDIGKAIVSLIENPAISNAKLDVDSGERQGTWSG
ncbi:SDR family oxidoreductase [Fulvivirga sp. M361]|uniref:SDR family oxidoreductase n=1 Tax=Fulvivirga sp. M361 TaxID=2594266 RepID=UPI00117B4C67|nr:SDR family oxidoreductase [Fulvivirga sp. M361]TRX58449.1 SDR family oxidoreductase [Fulvivirga sp. M361]